METLQKAQPNIDDVVSSFELEIDLGSLRGALHTKKGNKVAHYMAESNTAGMYTSERAFAEFDGGEDYVLSAFLFPYGLQLEILMTEGAENGNGRRISTGFLVGKAELVLRDQGSEHVFPLRAPYSNAFVSLDPRKLPGDKYTAMLRKA